MKSLERTVAIIFACLFTLFATNSISEAAEEGQLYIGWAATDITPDKPVALLGAMHKRIATRVHDPLTATVLALETRTDDGQKEQAIMVSCDLLGTRKAILDGLRKLVVPRIPDFDVSKLLINATHTHTAPGMIDNTCYGLHDVSKDNGVMKASEYGDFFLNRVCETVVKAWNGREPGGFSWGLGQAVVGHNRRAVYFGGRAKMYGATNTPKFSNVEGYEDHGVEMLFLWNQERKLTGIVINVPCPAQETEGWSEVSADFWDDVRKEIRKRYSEDLFVLPQCGASGDISPHLLFRKHAEQRMLERKGISRRQEIALRIANAVDNVFPYAREDIKTRVVFKHTVGKVDLPTREPPALPFCKTDSVNPIEFHVIRMGDVALATNPFELYLDYGIAMKAGSKAVLTFVVQLSCQHCGYLPTARAVKTGGYSAEKYVVGPQGGQILVNETVRRINAMWK